MRFAVSGKSTAQPSPCKYQIIVLIKSSLSLVSFCQRPKLGSNQGTMHIVLPYDPGKSSLAGSDSGQRPHLAGGVSIILWDVEKVVTFPRKLRTVSCTQNCTQKGMRGGREEVFIKIICIFKFHYSWSLSTCCPAGASAMWQTRAQGQPPAVSQTIGNHSTLNFLLSCYPPWLLTTPRAPSGTANFLLAPPLTCENSRSLWGEWWSSTGPYAAPLMIWHQTAERAGTVAGRLLYVDPLIWLILAALHGCCQWASQREGGQTAEQWCSLSQLENQFLKASRRHQLVLAADIWSGECEQLMPK